MKIIYQAGSLLIIMTLIAGIFYPALITVIGQLAFSNKSNGSLIKNGDEVVGSKLIAQPFNSNKYFWPRPSAGNFNTIPSQASNLGPTSKTLAQFIEQRRNFFTIAHGVKKDEIPTDLLTSSASGLDPHISIEAARLQIERIAQAREFGPALKAKLEGLIENLTETKPLQILGQKRINVFLLNLSLDRLDS